MSRSLWYLGVLLIIAGVVFSAVPTGSYSTIAGSRPVDVSIADDDSAVIALVDTGESVTNPGQGGGGTPVARLFNNFDSTLTVRFDVAVDTEAVTVSDPEDPVTIAPSDGHQITARCTPSVGGSGTATLTVTVIEATGDRARVTDAVLTAQFPYDCPGGGGGGNEPRPGNGVAYIDTDGDGEYDEGEATLTAEEVASFDDSDAELVVHTDGETVSTRREMDITAAAVTVRGTTLSSQQGVTIAADDGTVSFRDATIRGNNGPVEIEGRSLTAEATTIETNQGIGVQTETELSVTDSTLRAQNGEIALEGERISARGTAFTTNRDLSLAADGGPVDIEDASLTSQNGEISVSGAGVSGAGASITTNDAVSIDSEDGAVSLTDATVESQNGEIAVAARELDASGASIRTSRGISLTTDEGPLTMRDAAVTSQNGAIEIASAATLDAQRATVETNRDISLGSVGDMTLSSATLRTQNGELTAELDRETATLTVDGLTIRSQGNTLTYSPAEATVSGSPASGQVVSD